MRTMVLILLVLFSTRESHAQLLQVIHQKSQQPIAEVEVYSKNPFVAIKTDTNGRIPVGMFYIETDTIFFYKMGFEPKALLLSELASYHYLIELREKSSTFADVIIHGNKWNIPLLESPQKTERINLKTIAFQNPQTSADLLGLTNGVFIQKSQLGGGSPMLRGMATNRILLVVDGIRMNNAIFRSGNLQNVISLDANAIQQAEIIFGPGAVMYGSDAMGGVLNFSTLKPEFSKTNSKSIFSGQAMMRNSSANQEKTIHVDLSFGSKKWAFLSSFTHSDYGDLRSGTQGGVDYFYRKAYVQTIDNKDYMVPNKDSSLQVGSNYGQLNYMQKLRFKPNKHLEFSYGFHHSQTSSFNRCDRLYVMQTSGPYKNKLRWAEWYYGPQIWTMHQLSLVQTKTKRLYDEASLNLAWQKFEESRYDREFMVRELHKQKEKVDAWSVNLDCSKQLPSNIRLKYGVEWVQNVVYSIGSYTHVISGKESIALSRYPDGSQWNSLGIYTNATYSLSEKLLLQAGIRYSRYQIKANFDTLLFPFPIASTQMQNGTLNGSIGGVYRIQENWQLFINLASGFRSPNIDDMGKVFESTPGYVVVPNTELRPEKIYNLELGSIKTFGKYLKLDLTTYYSKLTDAMIRKDFTLNGQSKINYMGNPSWVQAVQNVANIYVIGLQFGFEIRFRRFEWNGSITYQNGKEQSADSLIYYPLRHAVPIFGNTHLVYRYKAFQLDCYAIYQGKMDYEHLALTERISSNYAKDKNGLNYADSWYTINLKTAFYIKESVSITLGVENITDNLYRPYSSGINAPGRNIITSLRVKF